MGLGSTNNLAMLCTILAIIIGKKVDDKVI